MSEVLHANIFFFITAVAVVVVGSGMAIALYYVVQILKDVRVVMSKVRKASNELERDFEELRNQVKSEGSKVRTVFDIFIGFLAQQLRNPRKRKKTKEDEHSAE